MRLDLPRPRLVIPATLMLILAACGPGGEAEPSTAGATATPVAAASVGEAAPSEGSGDASEEPTGSSGGSCEVEVTGDVSTTWEGSGGSSAVSTDYWYTDEELDDAAAILGGTRTEGEPVYSVLIVNCKSSASTQNVSLLPAAGSGFDDIPYGEGTYAISVPGEPGSGVFTTIFAVDTESVFAVSSPGELNLTKFDETGITGTFSFQATASDAREITVSGSFDFACTGRSVCAP